jgi:hypothetical protein
MAERQLGSKIHAKYTPPIQTLSDEREAFENAMAAATDSRRPTVAVVDGVNVVISDPGHGAIRSGRRFIPLGKIDSEF